MNLREIENIVVIRERNGVSFSSQLPDKHFTREEKVKVERLLLNSSNDFFFSRATLMVEGPTEIGAMPVFAKALDIDFDMLGVSLVDTGERYFGLWEKLLSGFSIPHAAMRDRDALMGICKGGVEYKDRRSKSSTVFCSLSEAGNLTKEETEKIPEYENKIVKVGDRENFPDDLFEEMKSIALMHNVYVLSSDFEGILKKEGYGELIEEAANIADSKVIQGKFVAEQISEKGKKIPSEFEAVLKAIKELATPIEKSR